jgi:RNA polymerase sigma-70 factor (ECF subfamily)
MDVGEQRELVNRAVAGDTEALERLLMFHGEALAHHIRPKLAGPMQSVISVEDILQETYYRAFQQIERFEPKSDQSFLAWLKTIAETRIIDAIKHQRRKKRGGGMRRVDMAPDAFHSTIAELINVLTDEPEQSPSSLAATDEAVQAMQVAIASLPTEQRQAVLLRYFGQKSLDEAGIEMDRSPEAVRGLLRRAKLALRAHMQRSSMWLSKR